MSKNNVLVAGIAGVVVLMSIALLKGMNGALLASAFTAIGAMVGFAFGYIGTSPGKPGETSGTSRKFLGLVAAAGLALGGCANSGITVEACVYSQKYGKICASLVGDQFKISADVELPQELLDAVSIDDLVARLKRDETSTK